MKPPLHIFQPASSEGDYRSAWVFSLLIGLFSAPVLIYFRESAPWLIAVPLCVGAALLTIREFHDAGTIVSDVTEKNDIAEKISPVGVWIESSDSPVCGQLVHPFSYRPSVFTQFVIQLVIWLHTPLEFKLKAKRERDWLKIETAKLQVAKLQLDLAEIEKKAITDLPIAERVEKCRIESLVANAIDRALFEAVDEGMRSQKGVQLASAILDTKPYLRQSILNMIHAQGWRIDPKRADSGAGVVEAPDVGKEPERFSRGDSVNQQPPRSGRIKSDQEMLPPEG
jgi:hypothetical protein